MKKVLLVISLMLLFSGCMSDVYIVDTPDLDGNVTVSGNIQINNTNISNQAGTQLCIGSDNKICKCGWCT